MTWPHFFVAGAVITLDRWSGETTKRTGTRPSALHSLNFPPFLKEVSQKCFVFDVVNFENGGSLAELLRFLTLSTSKIEEVCF